MKTKMMRLMWESLRAISDVIRRWIGDCKIWIDFERHNASAHHPFFSSQQGHFILQRQSCQAIDRRCTFTWQRVDSPLFLHSLLKLFHFFPGSLPAMIPSRGRSWKNMLSMYAKVVWVFVMVSSVSFVFSRCIVLFLLVLPVLWSYCLMRFCRLTCFPDLSSSRNPATCKWMLDDYLPKILAMKLARNEFCMTFAGMWFSLQRRSRVIKTPGSLARHVRQVKCPAPIAHCAVIKPSTCTNLQQRCLRPISSNDGRSGRYDIVGDLVVESGSDLHRAIICNQQSRASRAGACAAKKGWEIRRMVMVENLRFNNAQHAEGRHYLRVLRLRAQPSSSDLCDAGVR